MHKFQGQTVKSPEKAVIDAKRVSKSDPAQAYVMLSRVQELEQLFVLEKFPEDAIRVSSEAMAEIERLISVSVNKNPTNWESKDNNHTTKVCFLNCRSLVNKFENIECDTSLLKSDLLILIETWLEEKKKDDEYELPGYRSNFNSRGRGKGIASYFKDKFKHVVNINQEGFSLTKLESEKLDVIGIYRSQTGNVVDMINVLGDVIDMERTTVIGGDINICALTHKNNYVTASLKEMGFQQIVANATHVSGGAIDHVYINCGKQTRFDWTLEFSAKYYSDHDGLGLTMWELDECL